MVFQTDTLPAIGCLPEFSDSIYLAKKREKNKALILMGSNISQFIEYVHKSAIDDLRNLGNQYWPGALTIVVPTSHNINLKFISNENTLGLRIPNSKTAKAFIDETGPLATSSANISGEATALTAEEVCKVLPNINFLGPIPWDSCSGKASTIILWVSKDSWKLLRQGQISIPNLH